MMMSATICQRGTDGRTLRDALRNNQLCTRYTMECFADWLDRGYAQRESPLSSSPDFQDAAAARAHTVCSHANARAPVRHGLVFTQTRTLARTRDVSTGVGGANQLLSSSSSFLDVGRPAPNRFLLLRRCFSGSVTGSRDRRCSPAALGALVAFVPRSVKLRKLAFLPRTPQAVAPGLSMLAFLSKPTLLFLSFNGLRLLSVVGLCLVFASEIVTINSCVPYLNSSEFTPN